MWGGRPQLPAAPVAPCPPARAKRQSTSLACRFFLYVGVVWIVAVVADGAFWFFLLVGWTSFKPKLTHYYLNLSIQVVPELSLTVPCHTRPIGDCRY
jgi:hypothetical protein